ncbi:alanine racemase [Marimonas lutisalis]|uniref:alanine racemase n=1 Tax=Marimonas lutisalis TaxID=2545756 RepID=UPI0010F89FB7|nr:alanine racemase [Marimonas lutisalis]
MTSSYFTSLDGTLRGTDGPALVLDLDRLHRNLEIVKAHVQPGIRTRVAAKSLASLPLLDKAVAGLEAVGFMTFSSGHLDTLLSKRPENEHLLGKPFPVVGAAKVLATHPNAADRVIWLIDTPERAAQYLDLAHQSGQRLRVALEVDVGLHRGGVSPDRLKSELAALAGYPHFHLEGVMGYDAHLAKLPVGLRRREARSVRNILRRAHDALLPLSPNGFVNTGGSTSFGTYHQSDGVTEVSLGSLLVKPIDFDATALAGIEPALFIATPILKYLPSNPIPGLGILGRALRKNRADIAISGGYWKAVPVFPEGYGYSRVFGRSSNQEIWSGPALSTSLVDTCAFMRPTESEAIIQTFGEILVISGGELVDRWPTLRP